MGHFPELHNVRSGGVAERAEEESGRAQAAQGRRQRSGRGPGRQPTRTAVGSIEPSAVFRGPGRFAPWAFFVDRLATTSALTNAATASYHCRDRRTDFQSVQVTCGAALSAPHIAEVAELADAPGSGPGSR